MPQFPLLKDHWSSQKKASGSVEFFHLSISDTSKATWHSCTVRVTNIFAIASLLQTHTTYKHPSLNQEGLCITERQLTPYFWRACAAPIAKREFHPKGPVLYHWHRWKICHWLQQEQSQKLGHKMHFSCMQKSCQGHGYLGCIKMTESSPN